MKWVGGRKPTSKRPHLDVGHSQALLLAVGEAHARESGRV